MEVFRRAGFVLAVSLLAVGQVHGSHTATSAEPDPIAAAVVAVQADADLATAAPVQLAEDKRFKPSYLDKPCSFVPAKNPVKPKRNACRFV